MYVKILIALIITNFLAGCMEQNGQVGITSNAKNAIIYIDDEKKGMIGDGYTKLTLPEGEHKVRIVKNLDTDWCMVGEKDIYIGANSFVKINIMTGRKPTQKKIEREKRETFVDKTTGFMWQDTSKVSAHNWNDAISYCENSNFAGYDDWRLPNYHELLSIVDYKKYKPSIKNGFKNINADFYWTSSENVSDEFSAWSVRFLWGGTYLFKKTKKYQVRCVRDIQ